MNLRTLKKLSKRAAPLLPQLGDRREQFRAKAWENYTDALIMDRKHFERGRSVHTDIISQGEFKTRAKDGRGWIRHTPPCHPRKGTIMVGGVSGYYEPEWSEQTAWEALRDLVFGAFTDFFDDELHLTRPLDTPSKILCAAADILRDRA